MRKTLKNCKVEQIGIEYYDAHAIAAFLGISMNALHLRIHFDNFPKPLKMNGRLYFKMKDILSYTRHDLEKEAFAFLIRDEIRSLIDTGVLSRSQVGEMIDKNKAYALGGRIYARPISFERALVIKEGCEALGIKLEINNKEFSIQKKERLETIGHVWEWLEKLCSSGKLSSKTVGNWLTKKNGGSMGRSLLLHGPSFKIAKILHLLLLKKGYL